jgi:hypothetical protein
MRAEEEPGCRAESSQPATWGWSWPSACWPACATRTAEQGGAVLDRGGQLVAAMRMDGAQICAVPLAIDKAFTAVAVH